jgi:hypothetical protein
MKNGDAQNYNENVTGTLHLTQDHQHFVSVVRLGVSRARSCFPVCLFVWYRKMGGSPGTLKWSHALGATRDALILLGDMANHPERHDCMPVEPFAIDEMIYDATRFNEQIKTGNNGAWTLLPATPDSYVPKIRIVDPDNLSEITNALDESVKQMIEACALPVKMASANPSNPPIGRFPCRTSN